MSTYHKIPEPNGTLALAKSLGLEEDCIWTGEREIITLWSNGMVTSHCPVTGEDNLQLAPRWYPFKGKEVRTIASPIGDVERDMGDAAVGYLMASGQGSLKGSAQLVITLIDGELNGLTLTTHDF